MRDSNPQKYDLAGQVIGCAMEVHRTLGAGFLEVVDRNALLIELKNDGIEAIPEKKIKVLYRDVQVGFYSADLLVRDRLIVELKATLQLQSQDEVQLVNYLTATGLEEGLLLNFGAASLQFKKKYLNYKQPGTSD